MKNGRGSGIKEEGGSGSKEREREEKDKANKKKKKEYEKWIKEIKRTLTQKRENGENGRCKLTKNAKKESENKCLKK